MAMLSVSLASGQWINAGTIHYCDILSTRYTKSTVDQPPKSFLIM
jgi:hypothetical protein